MFKPVFTFSPPVQHWRGVDRYFYPRSSPRQLQGRADRGFGYSPRHALCDFDDVTAWHFGQLHETGRHRFRLSSNSKKAIWAGWSLPCRAVRLQTRWKWCSRLTKYGCHWRGFCIMDTGYEFLNFGRRGLYRAFRGNRLERYCSYCRIQPPRKRRNIWHYTNVKSGEWQYKASQMEIAARVKQVYWQLAYLYSKQELLVYQDSLFSGFLRAAELRDRFTGFQYDCPPVLTSWKTALSSKVHTTFCRPKKKRVRWPVDDFFPENNLCQYSGVRSKKNYLWTNPALLFWAWLRATISLWIHWKLSG